MSSATGAWREAAAPPQRPRLERSADRRLVGGVAAGLAKHTGLSARWIRLGFCLLNIGGGFGLLLYAAYWIVLPEEALPSGRPRESARTAIKQQVLRWGFVAAAVGTLVAMLIDLLPNDRFLVPGGLSLLGLAFIWRQASEQDRSQWWRVSKRSLLADYTHGVGLGRVLVGVALIVAGTIASLAGSGFGALRDGLFAMLATLTGVALITGPWWLRLVGDLSTERRARIRSQERAELAAHLHDSVLQTLALIQRNADSPREVIRLARGQERELRTLLYGSQRDADRLATALASVSAEIEDQYGIRIDHVVVGDAPGDASVAALVQATREALVNAAKHAKVSTVSLYAEVEPAEIAVYVRDRGVGFDEAAVPEDRQGVRGSIRDRMARHGGTADLRSSPGNGTEVELRMPRDAE
jgi:signal transduction histidine kinase